MKYFNLLFSNGYVVLLLCALFSTTVLADELLKLEALNVNDTPPNSENVIVVQDEQSGLKGIHGVDGEKGKIEFPIVLSSNDFEFTVETIFNDSTEDLSFFFTKGEQNLSFEITGGGSFSLEGEPLSRSDSWQSHAKNTVRFVVRNSIASLFVNEVFLKKVTLSDDKHNTMYDNLVVTNIEENNTTYRGVIKSEVNKSSYFFC